MTDFRPGRFQILPVIIKNLLIVNGLVFLAQFTFDKTGTFNMDNFFALHDIHSVYFKPHQLITHLFMHGGLSHLFVNMFALWMFGSTLENYWGPKRFLIFYIACGLGSAFLHLSVLYIENTPVMELFHQLDPAQQAGYLYSPEFKVNVATVGASGAVFGCLAAFGYLFPNSLIYIYFFLPLKAKWFVLIYAGIELVSAIQNSAGDNVAHWAHLGGALVGVILVWVWNKTNRKTFY
jgi:membrane associated rhomboid family serine protease